MMKKSKKAVISDAIKQHVPGICPLAAYHRANEVVIANRKKQPNEARTAMNHALRNTSLCAWFVYEYESIKAIQIRFGAEIITEFARK